MRSPSPFARAEEISIESAVGSPAVAITHRSAYISYAELKYPIPSVPSRESIGILKASPMTFTATVDKDSRSTPEIKLRASVIIFLSSDLAIEPPPTVIYPL